MALRLLIAATVLAVAAAAPGETQEAVGQAPALRGAEVLPALPPDDDTPPHTTQEPSNMNITGILTPPDATHPMDALMAFRQLFSDELRNGNYQWLVSVVAFGFGVTMLLSPSGSFKYIFIALVFAVTYTVAIANIRNESLSEHPDEANDVRVWEITLSLEFAVATSIVAWKGYHGIEYCIAISLSVWPLQLLQEVLVNIHVFGDSPYLNILVFTASVCIGIFLMSDHRLEQLLSYALPVFGGKIVSCSFGWLLFYVFEHTWSKAWIDFWHSLPCDFNDPKLPSLRLALTGAPGIGWDTPTNFNPEWAGAALGTVIWLLLSVVSVWYHHRSVAQKKVASRQSSAKPLLDTRTKE